MIVWSLVLRIVLDASFIFFVISKIWDYAGFQLAIDPLRYAESLLAYIIFLPAIPNRLHRPSDLLLLLLVFGLILPSSSLYGLTDCDRGSFLLLNGAAWLVLLSRAVVPTVSIGIIRNGPLVVITLLLVLAILTTGWMLQAGGLSQFNLRFDKVYEIRRTVPAELSSGALPYLIGWCVKVVGPSLIAICLWQRRYCTAAFAIALQVLWFALTSHKAVLFYPMYVLFLWARFRSRGALWVVPAAVSGVVVVSLLMASISLDVWSASLFIRRSMFVVAQTAFQWFDFFETKPLLLWSYTFGAAFADYPFELNPERVVGESLGKDANVNTSFIAYGYAQAGIAGIVIYACLVGLLLRIIDSVAARGIPVWLATAIMITPMHALLLASDLPTAVLSHGIALSLVVLLLIRSEREYRVLGRFDAKE